MSFTFLLSQCIEAVIPIDLIRPTIKLAEIPREDLPEIMEEKHDDAIIYNHLYQAKMKSLVYEVWLVWVQAPVMSGLLIGSMPWPRED